MKNEKKLLQGIAGFKNSRTFATAMTKWEVLYGQLLVNPPGLDRSKGSRSSRRDIDCFPPASLAQLARARDL